MLSKSNRFSTRSLFGIKRSSVEPRSAPHLTTGSTRLQKLVTMTQKCISELGSIASEEQLEQWACLIYESMSAPSRTFHSVQHVFDISENHNHIQTLAAFFHDAIYYNIDGGLSDAQKEVLDGVITENPDDGNVSVSPDMTMETDRVIAMVMSIFGFKPDQVLNPFKGLNEFLSAALAVRCLKEVLDLPELAAIATIIEATIPFREY